MMKQLHNLLQKSALGNNRGAALFIALALILALSAIGIMVIDRSDTDVDLSYNQMHSEQAFYIAEAGFEHAIKQLNIDYTWRDGFTKISIGEGAYTVTLTDSTTTAALRDTVVVLSTGFGRDAVAKIEVLVAPVEINPFEYAMFAEDSMSLAQNACTDSYNSDSGTYAATQLNKGGDLGSNGTITLSNNATIEGDASSATDGGIDLNGGTVTGDTSSTADSVTLDLIPPEEFAWAQSVSNTPGGLSGPGYSFNPSTDELTVNNNKTLELVSGVYYFSSITLGQSSELRPAPGAQVTIYIIGNLEMLQNADVNLGGMPSDIVIYSNGDEFFLNETNNFYGTFYGPNVEFQANQTSNIFGSVVAKKVKLDQNTCFHYDRQLKAFKKKSWDKREIIAWKEM